MIDYTGLGIALILKYKHFLLSISCLFLGSAGAWFISRTPMRLSLMDWPNDRSSHSVPTPRGGGIGIFLAVILAGLALKLPTNFLFPIIIVSMIGFYGDFFQLSVRFRLMVQFSAAFFVVFSLLPSITSYYLQSHPNWFPLVIILIPIVTAIYIAGSANFFNFMDGINGIAAISGTICFGLLGMYGYTKGQDAAFSQLSLFSIYVALACV
ncbi:MAG TPA: hypothetical protein DCG53_12730, partial [Syntrophus sp. (in: bacteria)]|nr:hypothetical protein [Syntrophus sp. (in: bacteria)]